MSPHHRWLILEASAVKSRRIASARAVAAGSGIVVFFHRRGARPASPAWRISRAMRFAGVPVPLAAQLGMDPRGAVPAPGPLVLSCDPGRELRVGAVPARRLPAAGCVVGGPGDLQQLARPLDVTLLRFLRLDERVAVHRVSLMLLCQAVRWAWRCSSAIRARKTVSESWRRSSRSASVVVFPAASCLAM